MSSAMISVDRIKRDVLVERLAAARGVILKRQGAQLIGSCLFHEDATPSLTISPEKNLWKCFGECGAGGGPIQFVMRADNVSFRRAVELLRERLAVDGVDKLPSQAGAAISLDDAKRSEIAQRIWCESKAAIGTLVETYLRSRGIAIVPPSCSTS
jgi:DNA primase